MNRLLAVPTDDPAVHRRALGGIPWQGPLRLLDAVEAAGLTGRGGAGFPVWRKMRAASASSRVTLIGNAAEGEPASAKDRTLLAKVPHLVLDGLQLAAEAVSAADVVLYLPAAAVPAVQALVRQRHSGDRYAVRLVPVRPSFVAGQETAVASAVAGGRPIPRDGLVRLVDRGVLVQNVETLAHLALIARYGPGWFRAVGTPDEPGTFLATVSGAVGMPGVYEVAHGTPLGDLLGRAGGVTEPLRAVLVGGFHGAWVPPLPDLAISRSALRGYDATPGAGVVVALRESTCGLLAASHIATYLAGERVGQCGPCENGLPRMAGTLERLAHRDRDPSLPAQVERLARLVTGRGACRHPDGTARFVRSTMRFFADEVDRHLGGDCVQDRQFAYERG